MSWRIRGYRRVTITMPSRILRRINSLADDVEISRSEVITDLCEYCLDRPEEVIDEIYPYEEYEEEEDDE